MNPRFDANTQRTIKVNGGIHLFSVYPVIFFAHLPQHLFQFFSSYCKILSCGIKLCLYLRFRDYSQLFGKIIIP